MQWKKLLLFPLIVCLLFIIRASGDDTDHGDTSFDTAAVFELTAGNYFLSFNAPREPECPAFVRVVLLKMDSRDLEEITGKAVAITHSEPVLAPGGKGIVILPGDVLYILPIEEERNRTEYSIRIDTPGNYIIFLEAEGVDFIGNGLFLTDSNSGAISPIVIKSF